MKIIPRRTLWFGVSGLLVLASLVAVTLWGLKLGIDFTGGAILEVEFLSARPDPGTVEERLFGIDAGLGAVQPVGERGMTLRFSKADEATHQAILRRLEEVFGKENVRELRFEGIGPTIGKELKRKAIQGIIIVLLAISLYIAWAFRTVSKPIASWRYGVATLVALFHDVMIPVGMFAILGRFFNVEVSTPIVVALLVVLGFSVHDTIVVFDRIRENLKTRSEEAFGEVVEASVQQTISRSINTSLTVIFVLFALLLISGLPLRYFTLALLVGIIAGTYSSIFIASPLLVAWERWRAK